MLLFLFAFGVAFFVVVLFVCLFVLFFNLNQDFCVSLVSVHSSSESMHQLMEPSILGTFHNT